MIDTGFAHIDFDCYTDAEPWSQAERSAVQRALAGTPHYWAVRKSQRGIWFARREDWAHYSHSETFEKFLGHLQHERTTADNE